MRRISGLLAMGVDFGLKHIPSHLHKAGGESARLWSCRSFVPIGASGFGGRAAGDDTENESLKQRAPGVDNFTNKNTVRKFC